MEFIFDILTKGGYNAFQPFSIPSDHSGTSKHKRPLSAIISRFQTFLYIVAILGIFIIKDNSTVKHSLPRQQRRNFQHIYTSFTLSYIEGFKLLL